MSFRDYRCEFIIVDTSVWGSKLFEYSIFSIDDATIHTPDFEVELMLPSVKLLKGNCKRNILFIFYCLLLLSLMHNG